jgi:hypothetical protein
VDEDEMLILAEKISEKIKRRVFERPSVFRGLAALDDRALDLLMVHLDDQRRRSSPARRRR